MTNEQIGNVAAGFLHALQTSAALYAEWTAVPAGDSAAYAAIIQRAMHLAAPPSAGDMNAMDDYLNAHLPDQIASFVKIHKMPPHTRLLCFANQT